MRDVESPIFSINDSFTEFLSSACQEGIEVIEFLDDYKEQIEQCLEVCVVKHTTLEKLQRALKRKKTGISQIRQLLYLPLYHENTEMFALVDTGAQVNIVAEALLPSIPHEVLDIQLESIAGIGSKQPLLKWIKTTLMLQNGQYVSLIAGVLKQLTCSIILGVAFLTDIEALINVAAGNLTSRIVGNLPLSRTASSTLVQTVQVVAQEDIEIEIKKRVASDLDEDQCKLAVEMLRKHAPLWQNQMRGVMTEIQH